MHIDSIYNLMKAFGEVYKESAFELKCNFFL